VVKKRTKYSIEFKEEAVRFARESGLTRTKVAAKLGVPLTTLTQWIYATEGEDPEHPTTFAEREEVTKLRREVELLRMERDFLKKAAAFFAKEIK
jgi:transposase